MAAWVFSKDGKTEYLWGSLLVTDYLEDREGSGKWMELLSNSILLY